VASKYSLGFHRGEKLNGRAKAESYKGHTMPKELPITRPKSKMFGLPHSFKDKDLPPLPADQRVKELEHKNKILEVENRALQVWIENQEQKIDKLNRIFYSGDNSEHEIVGLNPQEREEGSDGDRLTGL